VKAIRLAETESAMNSPLYCLGEIVHNQAEVARLKTKGLKFINHDEFKELKNVRVLLRAHGEPPSTYQTAKENGIELIDATCQVVQRLQKKIRAASAEIKNRNGQIVIFGKEDHPEIVSLKGQTNLEVIIIENKDQIHKIDFLRPIRFFSQTTKSIKKFEEIRDLIHAKLNRKNLEEDPDFKVENTICKQVSNREAELISFSKRHDVIIFVGGQNSSNAKFLFEICKNSNSKSYFVSDETALNPDWFNDAKSVGISGATSTPQWLMSKVADEIKAL
jgi:4-hydroxy-3-methylbut-2-enyl diphosphate reductase